MIGVDPHEGSHTAVAVDDREVELARLEVRSGSRQLEQLLQWAAPFETQVWAVESAGGWGYLLAQQLATAGEDVRGQRLWCSSSWQSSSARCEW